MSENHGRESAEGAGLTKNNIRLKDGMSHKTLSSGQVTNSYWCRHLEDVPKEVTIRLVRAGASPCMH